MTILSSALIAVLALTTTERLIEARDRAYDATYRNDAAALQKAAADLDTLLGDAAVGSLALYYAAWTEWSWAMSELQAQNMSAAVTAVERSMARARRALAQQPNDPEVLTLLANALVVRAIADRSHFQSAIAEVGELRKRMLAIAPSNPRVAMFDAGWMFNSPPDAGGGRDRGLTRLLEAIELFKREAAAVKPRELRPTWGLPLAYGALAGYYLGLTPPQHDQARAAAESALRLRPDYWYVTERVLPRLVQ